MLLKSRKAPKKTMTAPGSYDKCFDVTFPMRSKSWQMKITLLLALANSQSNDCHGPTLMNAMIVLDCCVSLVGAPPLFWFSIPWIQKRVPKIMAAVFSPLLPFLIRTLGEYPLSLCFSIWLAIKCWIKWYSITKRVVWICEYWRNPASNYHNTLWNEIIVQSRVWSVPQNGLRPFQPQKAKESLGV